MNPRTLRNFNLFVDGRGYAGRADEVTPPSLSIISEDHRAGGMDAPVEIDMGMEKMEMSIVLSEYNADVIATFGLLGSGVPLVLRGAIQRQGEDAVPVIIKATGNLKSRSVGSWKPGSKQTTSLVYHVRKYSETINGREMVNIDVENMIRVINGIDQLASQRAALGL